MRPSIPLRTVFALALAAGLAFTAGCRGGKSSGDASLYQRLGGADGVRAVVGDLFTYVSADQRINTYFADSNLDSVRVRFASLLGQATGGPGTYTGRDLDSIHAGMNITDADFDAMMDDLGKSLDQHRVAARDKDELLTLMRAMKGNVVGK